MDARLCQVVPDRELLDRARSIATAYVADARRRGDEPALVHALGYLGEAERIAARFPESEKALDEALVVATRRGDRRLRVAALIRLGELDRCRDRYDAAEALLREALSVSAGMEAAGYRHFALQHLGKTLLDASRLPEAGEVLEAALAIRRDLGEPSLIASTEQALAARASTRERRSSH
jgi:tetratricopeptide (TPR) repeat protein